jgi:phosphoribosylaminoimidazolecarboxamide formyltransferase / IMP cyclohydrolase
VDRKPIRRALISVYDKTGLVDLGNFLIENGITILSTGSTAKALIDAGVNVTTVESYTGSPEMLDGRVKTLHPRIHGGILADQSNSQHVSQLANHNIEPFDLIVINLYPFSQTVASGADFEECLEQIDIGGPSMLRGAAKNHKSIAVVSDPSQYESLKSAIKKGGFSLNERARLALTTFRKTAEYDIAIAEWLSSELDVSDWRAQIWEKLSDLRYGENPHQTAAIYQSKFNTGVTSAKQLHGKEMSFNNYTDADAALRAAYDHSEPCVAIIKHANPCGIATAVDIETAYSHAYDSDSISAFGGVVAANRRVSKLMAEKLSENFIEVVIAPGYDEGAVEILGKKPSIRILEVAGFDISPEELRPVSGGLLIQDTDLIDADGDNPKNWRQVSGGAVSDQVMRDLEFAWKSVRSVKSNGIVLAKNCATTGIGMGQVNRIDSAKLAIDRAGANSRGSVAASDAFFPFADGLEILIAGGVIAVVAPGGSVRDEEVIASAKASNIPMFFTGVRHFSHA